MQFSFLFPLPGKQQNYDIFSVSWSKFTKVGWKTSTYLKVMKRLKTNP